MSTTQQPVQLRAQTTSGHVALNAPISGDFTAELTDASGQPIPGRQITFYSTTTGQKIGTATTDQRGIAEMNSGSKVGSPVLVADVVASGADARFDGDDEYQPATAHAGTSVGA
ncbi:hypothetical protein ABTZ03_42335 [Kitasatospora sp. NPDC096077]|uniref:hypothetical protein n=1 Tax=Kitasatospora sp. NPDC096077 TaxID=3155544 RepID=UPI00332BDDAE